jgi:hypothetical protein
MRTLTILSLSLVAALAANAQTHLNGSQVIEGTTNYCEDAGSTAAYACNLTGLTGYVTGAMYCFKPNTTNAGTASLNLTGLGAKTIRKYTAGTLADLEANDIIAGQRTCVVYDGTYLQMVTMRANRTLGIGCVFDGGGSAVTVSSVCYARAPHACQITGWSILAQGTAPTTTIDVWKASAGTTLPSAAGTIAASAKPALATGNAVASSTLTGWTTAVAANEILGFKVDAIANATWIEVRLTCQ